ncbi:amidohydrolase family protein [Rubrivirga sp. IMCC45206]|uniref:amidohydrolase family protein n=1 Tax=Rubrivirga sp. IMCC45206 TaxID=3391614 RepID=UPI00398FCFCE
MPVVALVAAVLLAACSAPPRAAADSTVIAFEHVTVIPMDGAERALADHTVLVSGDRIVAVGPSAEVAVPDGATRVDGTGRYLIPGLAEMHGHVPPPQAPAVDTEETLFLYLASGITTVRGMLGADGQLALRDRAASGALWSPTLYLAGPSFNGGSVSSPEQAAAMVRQQAAQGWDLLKVHPGPTRAEYDAMAQAAREAGLRFGGHVPADVGLAHALDQGQATFDHLDGFVEALDGDRGPVDPAALAALVRATREAGAAVVPTMALWEVLYGTADLDALAAYPELAYVSGAQVRTWTAGAARRRADADPQAARHVIDNRARILAALHAGGVPVLMGTDAPQLFSVPGFSLHRELPYMVAAGMTPYEILVSGTTAVGAHFAAFDTFGSVAPGHRADLVLVDADPLADAAHLRQIAGVMVRGRWLPRDAIDRRLAAIADRHARD